MDRHVEIRRATPADIEALASTMHEDDQREMLALGYQPRVAVENSVRGSVAAYAGIGNGQVQALVGVASASALGGTGIPWMLRAEGADLWKRSIGLESVKFHRVLKQRFRRLENVVYARNHETIRWLQWLGYTIEEPEPFGPYRAPFRRFWMEC